MGGRAVLVGGLGHRLSLPPPRAVVAPVAAVYFGLTLISMAALGWAMKDEKPSLAA